MNMFGWIFSGVFLFFAALVILTGALKGRKYTWMYSVSRLIVVVLSVVVSVLIAKLVASLVGGLLYGVFTGLVDSDMAEAMESMSTAKDLVKLVVTVILCPLLFYPIFLIIRGLMTLLVRPLVALLNLIVGAIAKKSKKDKTAKKEKKPKKSKKNAPTAEGGEEAPVALDAEAAVTATADEKGKKKKEKAVKKEKAPKKEKKAKKPGRKERKRQRYGASGPNPIGAICGAVCSFMVFCVFLIPLTGALDLAEGFVDLFVEQREIAEESEEDDSFGDGVMNVLLDIGDGLCNNAGTKIVNYTGGKPVYRWMISAKVDGERVYLEDELDFAATATGAMAFYENKEPAEAAEDIREIGPAFEETRLLPSVIAEFLSNASDAWSRGEEYMGMESPLTSDEADEMMETFEKDVWEALKNTDENTVKADVTSIANMFAAMVEHDATDVLEGGDMLSMIDNQALTEKIFYEILANEQLEVLAESTLDYGIKTTLDDLAVRSHMDGAYEDMMDELSAVSYGSVESMAKAYEDILDRYCIPNDEDWTQVAENVRSGMSIRNYVATNLVGSQAEFEAKTELVTIDDVIATHEGQGTARVTDAAVEAKKLAQALYQMSVVLDLEPEEGTGGQWDMVALFPEFGPVLDALAVTEIIGYDETILFMTAFLQSPDICNGMKISTAGATSIATSIKNGTTPEGGFTPIMKSMGKTLDIVQKAAADNSETLKQEDIQELLDTMDHTTAEILQTMSTPEMIKEYGGSEVQDESAERISKMMGDIFVNFAAEKESGNMSEAQTEAESKAMTQMMNVMMSTGERNSESVFGEDSVLGVDADEYVETMLNSTVMSNTLVETTYSNGEPEKDPLKIGKALNSEEKSSLVSALNNQYQNASAEEKADADFQKKLYSTAAIMNVEVEITANGVEMAK